MHRIIKIKGCKTCQEVCIYRDRDCDSGNDYVRIQAWHSKDGDLYYQTAILEMEEDQYLIDLIIADFSEASANKFANSMIF